MANIKVELSHGILDGQPVTFVAPCDCTAVTGLKVYYPDGTKEFTFRDAHGNNLAGIGNLFAAGSYVKAILNVANGHAYIQNADTNKYIENTFLKRSGGTMSGGLDMGSNNITYLADPTGPMQATNKRYVDNGLGEKADSSHEHATSDITSGTLGVARGGIGRATLTANAIIAGNTTSAVKQIATANGAFYATAANGAAKFGTLPFEQGGTNATSRLDAAKALTNEAVSSPNYVVSLTNGWDKFGYTTLAQLRTALGIKDYVTAQGTSGNWHYRKYNSGYCECWRSITEQVTASQWEAWGGIYLTPGISVGAFPFTIYSAVPNVTAHNAGNNTLGVVTASDVSSSTMNEVRCFRGTKPSSTITVVYNIFVCGKWKE